MPEFIDRQLQCSECPAQFTFSAGEQKYFEERQLAQPPKRCPECRYTKKRARQVERSETLSPEFAATCSECNRETKLPFQPVNGRPVYCRNCFRGRDTAGRTQ